MVWRQSKSKGCAWRKIWREGGLSGERLEGIGSEIGGGLALSFGLSSALNSTCRRHNTSEPASTMVVLLCHQTPQSMDNLTR